MVPIVSVIIPTYDCGEYLHKALASVLEQNGVSMEVVVVDSSKDDSCARICRHADSRVRYMYQEPRGVSAARNLGIEHAQGEFIAFQDADDEWLPEKLFLQVSAFGRFPDAGLVFTDTMMFRDGEAVQNSMSKLRLETWCETHGSEVPGWYHGNLYAQLLKYNCMNTSSVMVPRKVLEQSGSFDEQLKIGEDYDLWLRIARHHPIVYLDRVCCKYRVREDGLSGAMDVRGVRWLDAHIAVREKHRDAHWIPPEHMGLLNPVLASRYWELGWAHFGDNRFREARKCFWKVLEIYPLRLRIWVYWWSSFLPIPIIESIRKLKARIVARKAQSLQRTEA